MAGETICVVDDDESSREALTEILRREGYSAVPVARGADLLPLLEQGNVDLVLTDLIMPSMSGLAILEACLRNDPDCQVIMITGYGTVETAVQAMRDGAFHYLAKPVKPAEVKELVRKALAVRRLRLENRSLRDRVEARFALGNLIGTGPAMERVFELIRRVAPTRSTVLITGESGTGKEVVANAIHENSHRSGGPYVKVNCGAIVESLLESELFGHVQGAFTGAIRDREGRFQLADGGTLFLDEVGELSPTMQTRLLRVLQEGEVEPVGGSAPRKVDVRIIAATNRDLAEAVRDRSFREDLYYRLKVVTIHLPPLRERLPDIPLFVSRFIDEFSALHGRKVTGVTSRALDALRRHPWPGNVRELRNVIEGIVVTTAADRVDVDCLPADVLGGPGGGPGLQVPVGASLEDVEREMIVRTLESVDGNRTRAAAILGVSLRTLQRKLKTWSGSGDDDPAEVDEAVGRPDAAEGKGDA